MRAAVGGVRPPEGFGLGQGALASERELLVERGVLLREHREQEIDGRADPDGQVDP